MPERSVGVGQNGECAMRKFQTIMMWVSPALVLAGMALIIATLLWVNLSRLFAGMHSYA